MKKIMFSSAVLIVFCLLNVMCVSENKYVGVKNQIDSLLNANYRNDAPGCALMICKGDEVIYQGERGIADVKTKESITGNTVFNIASITKQFTTTAILKLYEEGRLSIEDSVAKYMPEFKSEIWKKVKIKHLMSQCSGVPDNRPRVDKDFMLYIVDAQCLEYMVELDELKFEPGTYYDYKNPTFQLLAEIVKRVSGCEFEEFQHKNIFAPSNMTNVRYFDPKIEIPSMAHGYINVSQSEKSSLDSDSQKEKGVLTSEYIDSEGKMWMEYDYGEETFFGTKADGGIYTSVNDFMNWEKSLLKNLILKEETRNLAYTPHIEVYGSKYSYYQNRPYTSYGYGWFIDETPDREVKVYHTGDNGGFQAYAAKYLESGVNVIMLENRNDIDRWSMQLQIEQILIDAGLIKLKK